MPHSLGLRDGIVIREQALKPSFANNCLLARRLVEKGVRFVQLFHEAWDQHGNLVADLKKNCADTDQATAALLTDLKQRGLLKDTLVIWGGEFGYPSDPPRVLRRAARGVFQRYTLVM